MIRQVSRFLLLATCVQLSYQICHNNVCDSDKCTANGDCPQGFVCESTCGYCEPIPGYCLSNNMCDNFDGMCDTENDPYTTCMWCDLTDHTCKPGCITNSNCDSGFECNNHLCVEKTSCTDDAYCNQGLEGICDIDSSPYTQCMYCEGGDCLPGCLENANCPSGFTCQSHKCTASAGQVLIDSITIKTSECNGCTTEGVTAVLKGESVVGFPYGIPCATNKLDRDGTTEFGPGGSARFDGKLNGSQNDDEESMIGGCFHAPLNNVFVGGTLNWQGAGTWEPLSVCIDWLDGKHYANECKVTRVAGEANQFELVKCHDLTPKIKCE